MGDSPDKCEESTQVEKNLIDQNDLLAIRYLDYPTPERHAQRNGAKRPHDETFKRSIPTLDAELEHALFSASATAT
jgi:hypothetical protein